MGEVARTINYLFVLSVLLIVIAYYAGSNKLISTLFAGTNTLGLTFTGRTANGQFAAYPQNAPVG